MAAAEFLNFEWRTPGLYKAPAQTVGEICDDLSRTPDGLTPATLLDAARDEASPLHDDFEWRDDVAAEKYRQRQAQDMIRNLRIVVKREDSTEQRERSFVVTGERKSIYVPLLRALSNEEWKKSLLAQAETDAQVFLAKYQRLEELQSIVTAMRDFIDK